MSSDYVGPLRSAIIGLAVVSAIFGAVVAYLAVRVFG